MPEAHLLIVYSDNMVRLDKSVSLHTLPIRKGFCFSKNMIKANMDPFTVAPISRDTYSTHIWSGTGILTLLYCNHHQLEKQVAWIEQSPKLKSLVQLSKQPLYFLLLNNLILINLFTNCFSFTQVTFRLLWKCYYQDLSLFFVVISHLPLYTYLILVIQIKMVVEKFHIKF